MKSAEERFWEKVSPEPNSGCFLWIAGADRKGYGGFHLNGKLEKAHRVAYEWQNGKIPSGLQLDHLCRVRCCVNPDHLEPVTNQENSRRGLTGAHEATKTHCPQGHAYDAANTYRNGGKRYCRACGRARYKRH